jgi:hypothetical protein
VFNMLLTIAFCLDEVMILVTLRRKIIDGQRRCDWLSRFSADVLQAKRGNNAMKRLRVRAEKDASNIASKASSYGSTSPVAEECLLRPYGTFQRIFARSIFRRKDIGDAL